MKTPAPQGERIVGVVAALAVAAVQIAQAQRVVRGLGHRRAGCRPGLTLRQKRVTPTPRANIEKPNTTPNISASVLCGNTA